MSANPVPATESDRYDPTTIPQFKWPQLLLYLALPLAWWFTLLYVISPLLLPQITTPEGEINEMLLAAYGKMPRDQWWAWRERIGIYKTLGQLYEAAGYASVRDLRAELKALQGAEEAEEAPAAEDGTEAGNMLPFRPPPKQ